jgi:hypothetical protein
MGRKLFFVNMPAWLMGLCVLALRCEDCRSEEIAPPSNSVQGAPGVLVLQDGGVLTGTICREGDHYLLTRGGAEIRISCARVLLACSSLDEAYNERRKQIGRPSAEAHLALAEWCLRQNLETQAARELSDARAIDADHPRLALLDRRLAAAGQRPRPHDPAVKPAAAEVATAASLAPGQKPEWATAELPAGALELFTRKVQPILVNNCTVSGCHQPGGQQSFQLDRALLRGLANRRSTMQNLAATLAIVDREQPHLSPLLTVPRRTHGGMRRPVFGPRQSAAFTHVIDWVTLVTGPEPSDELVPPSSPNSFDSAGDDRLGRYASTKGPILQAGFHATSDAQADQIGVRPDHPQNVQFGAQLWTWQPKDPFDPEIFNRLPRPRALSSTDDASAITRDR